MKTDDAFVGRRFGSWRNFAAKAVDFKMTACGRTVYRSPTAILKSITATIDACRYPSAYPDRRDRLESLKGVMFFEIGHQNWARPPKAPPSAPTARKSGPLQLRGLDHSPDRRQGPHGPQPYVQPTFTGIGPDPRRRRRGHHHQQPVHRNVSAGLFWLRAMNNMTRSRQRTMPTTRWTSSA